MRSKLASLSQRDVFSFIIINIFLCLFYFFYILFYFYFYLFIYLFIFFIFLMFSLLLSGVISFRISLSSLPHVMPCGGRKKPLHDLGLNVFYFIEIRIQSYIHTLLIRIWTKAYCLFSSSPNTYNIYCEHLWPKHIYRVSRWLYKRRKS